MKYKSAIIYGLLSGVVIVCYHLGVYFGNIEWLVSPAFFFSIYLVHLPFMLSSGLIFRRRNEGLVDFKDALREIFITFLVGMAIYYICYYAMFTICADELIPLQKEAAYDKIMMMKEKAFYDEDEIKEWIKAWENASFDVTLGAVLKGVPFRIIGGFVMSLIVAVMVRR
ncbi:MAG: hypothetical protein ACI94Y_004361 [Maribacter sp.]|jgi:hypothetical protein